MSITTLSFYIMIAIAIIIYYVLPLKIRWIVLFACNGCFMITSNGYKMTFVAISIVLWTYVGALLVSRYKDNNKISKAILIIFVCVLVVNLLFFKEQLFFVNTLNKCLGLTTIQKRFSVYQVVAPIGISYFSLILMSYICEVYWGTIDVQKNPLKLITYGLFFPVLTSGPILKYKETADEIFIGKRFSYTGFCFGTQRILWGFFKKLVISERLSIIVSTIYGDTEMYCGLYIPVAAGLFTLQLYADFSGCIDIIMGGAELFGIKLPENFDCPFYAKTVAEFWRRWHITLGTWLKEYILYPILKSRLFQWIGTKSKKKFGKKIGKKIPTWIALLCSWFLIGLWHGGSYNYIFGVGIYMGVIIILSEIFTPVFIKAKSVLRINDQVFSWKLFQSIRTFCLFSFGLSFFRAPSLSQGFKMWKNAISLWNPWIFFDGSLENLGLSSCDFRVLQLATLLLIITGFLSAKKEKTVRILISEQNIMFRWSVWILLIVSILVFGKYGPGYDAAEFIYGNF